VRHLVLAAALLVSAAARADGPPAAADEEEERFAWEMDLFAGYGQLAFPTQDIAGAAWSNGGPAFALGFAYRGAHLTHPFVDISYIPILSSAKYVNVLLPGGSSTVYATNSSFAIGLAIGPGWDIDWFRVRVGVGVYDVFVKTDVIGQPHTVSQIGIGFFASLGALVWRPDPFALGAEARLVALTFPTNGIYQTMWSAGLTGRWDFVRN
jgi:opacity protein-like surface antigen